MARRRILVAVVPPVTVGNSVRTLRRTLGDQRSERITPHVTVIPPFNIADEIFADYRRHVRSVVTVTRPFAIWSCGFGTFLPAAPTIHLEMTDGGSGALAALRRALSAEHVVPGDPRPFRPHMTIRSRASQEQIGLALGVTSQRFAIGDRNDTDRPLVSWQVDSVQIMEQRHLPGTGTRWVPFAEESFGPSVVVGRGGVELVIRTASVLDAGTLDADREADVVTTGPDDRDTTSPDDRDPSPGDGRLLCVTAELPESVGAPIGAVTGLLTGVHAELTSLRVDEEHRGIGIGHQLLAHWSHRARDAGAAVAVARAETEAPEVVEFLASEGFTRVGRWLVRDVG